jgi:hypothetical protein
MSMHHRSRKPIAYGRDPSLRAGWLVPCALLIVVAAAAAPAQAACTTTATQHCLQGKRFAVEIEWAGYVGDGGVARTVSGGTADSGLFYFYGPDNWEVLVKVLNGCHQNDHFWVFSAAATTLEYTITVTDTLTGAVRTYSNPLGVSSPAITDIEAFKTCGGTKAGAQIRYYNNVFCNGSMPFTSTLAVNNYSWQSLTQVPSPYQLVQRSTLGPQFVEVNDSDCGDQTYNGTFEFAFNRKYAIAQSIENGSRTLLLLDEGPGLATAAEAASAMGSVLDLPLVDGLPAPTPPLSPPRVVARIVAD